MVELKIIEKTEREYVLELVESKQQHRFQIKFFDLVKEVVVGDVILMNENLLNKGYKEYSRKLMFGALDKPYGRKIESRDHPDLLCVKKNGEEYWLKRFWG
ncbi:MAG: hypothetical protein E7341_04700 [Clostridiales bacterium]|nr:hypothetical protein [Clostridiales bacterium]